MTLVEICEPLFSYICRLNRAAKLGTPSFEPSQVRGDVETLLRRIGDEADAAGRRDAFLRVRKPLIYFADYLIAKSAFEWAVDYPRLANDENEYAGDERFFRPLPGESKGETLDEALAEQDTADNKERLAVFYECLGLGFAGIFDSPGEENQDQLKTYIKRVASRLGDRIDPDETARICPEAYKHTDRTVIEAPVRDKLGAMSIVAIGCLVTVFVVSGVVYHFQTNKTQQLMQDFTAWASGKSE